MEQSSGRDRRSGRAFIFDQSKKSGRFRYAFAAFAVLVSVFSATHLADARNGMLVAGAYVGAAGDSDIVILCDDRYTGTAETCAVPGPGGTSQGVPANVGTVVGDLKVVAPRLDVETDVTLKATAYGGLIGGQMADENTFVDVCLTSKEQKKGGPPTERTRGDNICARIINNNYVPSPSERAGSIKCGAITWKYDNAAGDTCSAELSNAEGSFSGFDNLGFLIGLNSDDASVPGAMAGTVCNGRRLVCEPTPAENVKAEGMTPLVVGKTPGFVTNFCCW